MDILTIDLALYLYRSIHTQETTEQIDVGNSQREEDIREQGEMKPCRRGQREKSGSDEKTDSSSDDEKYDSRNERDHPSKGKRDISRNKRDYPDYGKRDDSRNERDYSTKGKGDDSRNRKRYEPTKVKRNDSRNEKRGDNSRRRRDESLGDEDNWTGSSQKKNNFKDKRGRDKYTFDTDEGIKVRLYKGSIVNLQTDAIVNAANGDLDNCGGVAKVISDAAGRALERECKDYIRQNKKLNVSETCVTGGGKLPCNFVIHAVGPNWHDYRGDEDVKVTCLIDLALTVENILRAAEKYNLSTVVMPPLSSGIFAVPTHMCAAMYLKGILDFSGANRFGSIKEFHIIDIKDEILDLVEECHKAFQRNTKEIDPLCVLQKHSSKGRPRQYGSDHQGIGQSGARRRRHQARELTDRNSEPFPDNQRTDTSGNVRNEKKDNPSDRHDLRESRQEKKEKHKGSELDTGYTAFQIGQIYVYIYTGDIVQLKDIDGLVSPENQYLNGCGKLSTAIMKLAGANYQKDHKGLALPNGRPRPLNDVLVTPAGNLGYARVLHAVTRQLSDKPKPSKHDLDSLEKLVYNVLRKFDKFIWMLRIWKNFVPASIAMPLLGAGALQDINNIRMCCLAMYFGIEEYLSRHWMILKLHAIHLVNKNPVFTNCLREVFLQMTGNIPYDAVQNNPDPNQAMVGTPHPRAGVLPSPYPNPSIPGQYKFQSYPQQPVKQGHAGQQRKRPSANIPSYPSQSHSKEYSRQNSSEFDSHQNQSVGQSTSDSYPEKALQYPYPKQQTGKQMYGGRSRHRQFGVGHRPWYEKRQSSTDESSDSKKRKFDPSKYKSIDTWKAEEEKDDTGDQRFGKYMQKVMLASKTEEKPNKAAKDPGNLNIIDDGDDQSGDDSEILGAHADPTVEEDYDCVICLSTIEDAAELKRCKHKFCRECIIEYFKMKSACPVCSMVYGELYGDQPLDGIATVYVDSNALPGYTCPTLIIAYEFPDGVQEEYHPAPGEPYKGISRQGYLPKNREGKEILKLLKTAFKQRLVFTIGASRTSGKDNVVTWNDIHHKTRREGGPERYGYPDEEYLSRVKDELLAKGIE
ncbi:hypothetical protein FSP39_016972 [Pinctada imbricata]|uniref:RING-type E3 ubiquitin transferase n=1 Tax=Pinctada imbricata TaxID=66713 RepID=A0AA88YBF7_PINIB|nr:hypothetical protein FSP39_016972 [Pinctada imbricata]